MRHKRAQEHVQTNYQEQHGVEVALDVAVARLRWWMRRMAMRQLAQVEDAMDVER